MKLVQISNSSLHGLEFRSQNAIRAASSIHHHLSQFIMDDETHDSVWGTVSLALWAVIFCLCVYCYLHTTCRANSRDNLISNRSSWPSAAEDTMRRVAENHSSSVAEDNVRRYVECAEDDKRRFLQDNLIIRMVVAGGASKENEPPMEPVEPAEQRDHMTKSERSLYPLAAVLRATTSSFQTQENQQQDTLGSVESFDIEHGNNAHGSESEKEERQAHNPPSNHLPDDKTKPATHSHKVDIFVPSRSMSMTIQDYDQPTKCDICLFDYEMDDEVAWSSNEECTHAFHKDCITDWLLRNPKCPLCRRDYVCDMWC